MQKPIIAMSVMVSLQNTNYRVIPHMIYFCGSLAIEQQGRQNRGADGKKKEQTALYWRKGVFFYLFFFKPRTKKRIEVCPWVKEINHG